MSEKPNNIIPIERGLEIKEEEIDKLQKQIEKGIEELKEVLEELNTRLKTAEELKDEEQITQLQGHIFAIEHQIEEGENLIDEGDWKKFDLWQKQAEAQWKREDKK
jgi:uncharacterized protein YwgA